MADWTEQLVERFTIEVEGRLGPSLPHRQQVVEAARQALSASITSLGTDERRAMRVLPVTRLKAADVIAQGLVAMSQPTLYRAADQGRFYCTTPGGRSIGKEFPAWQFVEPVPELIESILQRLSALPASEVHAFWVTCADELNELAPAEVLAGMPFDTRGPLHPSQQTLLAVPTHARRQKIEDFAAQQSGNRADVIS